MNAEILHTDRTSNIYYELVMKLVTLVSYKKSATVIVELGS